CSEHQKLSNMTLLNVEQVARFEHPLRPARASMRSVRVIDLIEVNVMNSVRSQEYLFWLLC
ncbi:MAG: hypothetical protein SFW36_09425, partial [Leptolyngbyaceae cyanobacterium bins.59]|nr:hypothetical protein [Leptolyngbyaceae cyanobacterium bins.59]